jgi:hypothetical protein
MSMLESLVKKKMGTQAQVEFVDKPLNDSIEQRRK